MVTTATQAASLVTFTLPGNPYSVQMARFCVQAVLSYHNLDHYTEDAAIIASELITNAIKHASAETVLLALTRLDSGRAIAIVVTDPSPLPPMKRASAGEAEQGRGLHIVEALSAYWGWQAQTQGKAVYAILTQDS